MRRRADVDRILGTTAGRSPRDETSRVPDCVDVVPSSNIIDDDDDDGPRPTGMDVVYPPDDGAETRTGPGGGTFRIDQSREVHMRRGIVRIAVRFLEGGDPRWHARHGAMRVPLGMHDGQHQRVEDDIIVGGHGGGGNERRQRRRSRDDDDEDDDEDEGRRQRAAHELRGIGRGRSRDIGVPRGLRPNPRGVVGGVFHLRVVRIVDVVVVIERRVVAQRRSRDRPGRRRSYVGRDNVRARVAVVVIRELRDLRVHVDAGSVRGIGRDDHDDRVRRVRRSGRGRVRRDERGVL